MPAYASAPGGPLAGWSERYRRVSPRQVFEAAQLWRRRRSLRWPGRYPSHAHLRVDDVDRRAGFIRVDLIEDVGELQLPLLAGDVSDVGSADDVVHGEQWMSRVAYRFVLEHINGGHTRTARLQCLDECPWLDEPGAAGVDKQGRRLHPSQVVAGDDAARRRHKPHVEAEHGAGLEEGFLALCCREVIGASS